MATITQFDPPGGLDDFDPIPIRRQAWSGFLVNTFQANVQGVEQFVGAGKLRNEIQRIKAEIRGVQAVLPTRRTKAGLRMVFEHRCDIARRAKGP